MATLRAAGPPVSAFDAEQAAWRERTVKGILWMTIVVVLTGGMFTAIVLHHLAFGIVMATIATAMLVSVLAKGLGYRARAIVLVSAVQVGLAAGCLFAGNAPNNAVVMCVYVVVATMLLGRRWGIATVAASSATMLVTGALHQLDAFRVVRVDPNSPMSVVRITLMFTLLGSTVVLALSYLLGHADRMLAAKVAALARLEREQAEKERIADELRQREAAFHKAREFEILGRLAGSVAHDFNNALLIMQMSADLARDDPSYLEKGLRDINDAIRQAAATTRQLRAFGPQAGRPPVTLSISETVERTGELLRRILPKNIELHVSVAGEGLVRADEGQVQGILTNLALNARDAMPEGGRLDLRERLATRDEIDAIGLRNSFVAIEVEDDGAGIGADTMKHLFEPFFTTKGALGTGLGLASVKALVEDNGGRIVVTSRVGTEEHGTKFVAYWPLAEESASPSANPLAAAARPVATVLVVDDDDQVRRVMATAIARSGCKTLEASGVDDALMLARRHREPIDVMCTDTVMPGPPVRQLIEGFRAAHPKGRVLVCSGYAPADAPPPPRNSVDAFLPKPFTPDALARAIAELTPPSPVRAA